MMRAYALDSQSGTHAPEAWGIIKTVIQAAKSKSTPLEEIYFYAQDLARANGPLEQGKEVSTWDAWFDGIGKFSPRLKYGTGMIGFAATSHLEAFSKFLNAFDAAVPDASDRRVEYVKTLKNLVEAGNLLEAAMFFEGAREKGVEFDAHGYCIMIQGLATSSVEGKDALILGLVERAKNNGFKGRGTVLNSLKASYGSGSSQVVDAYASLL
ncbi:UNVERIFIED_CONTAM: hypothetical protein HDU68_008123 [Siphonaria sp. JEL0065]|nr:hypothetical protein HDU68_008123 [Siphonaria sp. JEL0065]